MEKYLNLVAKTESASGTEPVKFEKNPGYKNVNTSQYNKLLVTKNTNISWPSCMIC